MKKRYKGNVALSCLIAVFILILTLLTVFCVRPTAVGYSYSGEISVKYGVVLNYTYHFHSTTKLTQIMETEGFVSEKEYWYFEHDGYIVKVGLYEDYTKEEYKQAKQEIIDNWDENSIKLYNTKINAFYISEGQEILLSTGSIITVSVLGGIDVIMFIFIVVMLSKKRKNKSQKPNEIKDVT